MSRSHRSLSTVLTRGLFRTLLGRRLPISTGTLKVSGIEKPLHIRRDRYGVPYIEAADDVHMWFGIGFCMGQDRTFQLEFLARAARGTLAALTGPDGLPIDRLTRRLGLERSSEAQYSALDDDVRIDLDAFVRGVNAGIHRGRKRVPHEMTLLRRKPLHFKATDAIGIVKLLAFAMGTNWDSELARLRILADDGAEALAALDPVHAKQIRIASEEMDDMRHAAESIDRLAQDIEGFRHQIGGLGGSNNFAVDGTRSATGRPLLANDPHLPPNLPNAWYLVHAETPEHTVSGAHFAGAPGFIFGYNGTAAWGVTAGHGDNTDLFVENVSEDGRSVFIDGEWVRCKVRREVIEVRGKPDVVEEVLETPHGPVISPALDGEHGALSIRATWLGVGPARGVISMHKARTIDDVRSCMQDWPGTTLNMIFATEGEIAWHFLGHMPVRKKGWGAVPQPTADAEVGWFEEVIPVEQLPHIIAPESGALATANSEPDAMEGGPFLGGDWFDCYRKGRALECMTGRDDWSLASMAELQLDTRSVPWRELSETVMSLTPTSARADRAKQLLAEWDGRVEPDSIGASVFELFLADMIRRIVHAKAPRSAAWALGKGFMELAPNSSMSIRRVGHAVHLVSSQPEGWFEGGWPEQLCAALEAAIETLEAARGKREDRWAWGDTRTVTFVHPVGEVAALAPVFNIGPLRVGGDTNTLQCASVDPANPTANPVGIATMRMVVEVGNWKNNRWALAGGQSGNPLSPHYDDMIPLWARAEGAPIAWTPEAVREAAVTTLEIQPVDAQPRNA